MTDLIKRLRLQSEHIPVRTLFDDAADRIEELEAKLTKAVESIKQSIKLWEKPDGGDRLGKLDNAYDGFELLFKALAELEVKE